MKLPIFAHNSSHFRQTVSGNRTVITYVYAILVSLGFIGNPLAGEIVQLYESDSGKMVEIHVGDDLEIVLPGNPTTGYVWEVSSHNPNQLRLGNSDFYAHDKSIGSGGMEIVKLQAIAEGKSQLKLIFHRPFEHSTPPLKTFDATIIIEKLSARSLAANQDIDLL